MKVVVMIHTPNLLSSATISSFDCEETGKQNVRGSE
jgi:hypothetical protein